MRLIAPLVIVCLSAGTATVAPAYGSPGVVSDIAKGGVARSVAPAAARPAGPRAGAAITIGRTNPSNSAGASCGGPIQVIVQESSTAPTTYATPTAGVITSYSHNARAGFTGHLRLLAFTPLGSGTYTQV